MPRYLPPRIHRARGPGFTLIEVLVVVIIIGVLVGVVSIAARPNEAGILRVEAERLAHLLELASDDARFSGRPVAWVAEDSGYRFWRWRPNVGWSEVLDDDLLRPRQLPPGMRVSRLEIERRPVPGNIRIELAPLVQTFSFSIELELGSGAYTVDASPVGEFTVRPGRQVAYDGMASR